MAMTGGPCLSVSTSGGVDTLSSTVASWAGPAFWPGPVGLPAALFYFFLILLFVFFYLIQKLI
jgi:hypothetical protein